MVVKKRIGTSDGNAVPLVCLTPKLEEEVLNFPQPQILFAVIRLAVTPSDLNARRYGVKSGQLMWIALGQNRHVDD